MIRMCLTQFDGTGNFKGKYHIILKKKKKKKRMLTNQHIVNMCEGQNLGRTLRHCEIRRHLESP